QLHEIGRAVTRKVIVERCIAAGDGLQTIVEIQNDFIQRHLIRKEDAARGDVLEPLLLAAFLFDKLEDRSYKFIGAHDESRDDGFFDLSNVLRFGKFGRIVYFLGLAVRSSDAIAHAWRGGNQRQLELPLESLLDDFHMEQSQKAASKAESKRRRGLGLIKER